MIYQEFKPSDKLKYLIDSYWLITGLNQFENQRVLPDGCMDIIFNLGKANNSIPKDTIAISGMMTKFSDVLLDNDSKLLGVRFKPGQLSNLTNYPLFEIKNNTIDASEIIPELNLEVLEQVEGRDNIKQGIALIDSTIYKILNRKKLTNDALISSVTNFILNSSEPVIISKITKNHFISLRQLERRFKYKIGVTLKEFTNIVRFNNAMKSISSQPDKSILHIAFDMGYYDHSHLTNEFKRFSGQTPSKFR